MRLERLKRGGETWVGFPVGDHFLGYMDLLVRTESTLKTHLIQVIECQVHGELGRGIWKGETRETRGKCLLFLFVSLAP